MTSEVMCYSKYGGRYGGVSGVRVRAVQLLYFTFCLTNEYVANTFFLITLRVSCGIYNHSVFGCQLNSVSYMVSQQACWLSVFVDTCLILNGLIHPLLVNFMWSEVTVPIHYVVHYVVCRKRDGTWHYVLRVAKLINCLVFYFVKRYVYIYVYI